jgi:SAM-dependent methyltransferase
MLREALKKVYRGLLPPPARRRIFRLRTDAAVRLAARCDVCRGRAIEPFTNGVIARLEYNFYRCRACDFIFVHPKPDPADVYTGGEVVEMGAGESVWNAGFLEAVEKYSDGRGRLLEVGFGDAGFLRLAHEAGWETHGAELSEACVRHARDVLGLPNVRRGTLAELSYPEGFFDVVAAFNFIEHVPDLRATLRDLRRILRPGGLLVLLCPNIAGVYHRLVPELFGDEDPLNITWVPPYHLSYFNRDNFRRLLEDAGFTVVGDESGHTPALWQQHEVSIGPRVTGEQLESLADEIRSSPTPAGETRADEFRPRIAELLRRRLSWAFVADVMALEGALGSENAILYVSRKGGEGATAS